MKIDYTKNVLFHQVQHILMIPECKLQCKVNTCQNGHFTKGFKNVRVKVILLRILWILQLNQLRLQRGIGSMNDTFSLRP